MNLKRETCETDGTSLAGTKWLRETALLECLTSLCTVFGGGLHATAGLWKLGRNRAQAKFRTAQPSKQSR